MFEKLVTDYQYIHLAIGIIGNTSFVIGSILFFSDDSQVVFVARCLFPLGKAAKDISEAKR